VIRARKRFGQHFLHDPAVIARIVHAVAPQPGDHLVEIGPGHGALTDELLARPYASFDAVEIDRDLAAQLRPRLQRARAAALHEADALEVDFRALACARGGRLRIVGNLPYNVSTPLLFHLLDAAPSIRDLHVMLQREVAARMAAAPGSSEYGRLGVMLAPWVRVERLFEVGPGAFRPAPRVWSAVVRLTVREQPAFEVSVEFARVVSLAFSHRRKTVRNALRSLLEPAAISACGIDPGARPETLEPAAFNALARQVAAAAPPPPQAPASPPQGTIR